MRGVMIGLRCGCPGGRRWLDGGRLGNAPIEFSAHPPRQPDARESASYAEK